VPTSQVERILEVEPSAVERVADRTLLRLDDGVVPLRHAGEALLDGTPVREPAYALIVHRHQQAHGIGIDEVLGYEQIVAKPLPSALRQIRTLSGVTILGEGRVVFIVDLLNL
jgi:two-component system chemotaxis sensor kinase CheA